MEVTLSVVVRISRSIAVTDLIVTRAVSAIAELLVMVRIPKGWVWRRRKIVSVRRHLSFSVQNTVNI